LEEKSERGFSSKAVAVMVIAALIVGAFAGYFAAIGPMKSGIPGLESRSAEMVYKEVAPSVVSINTGITEGSGFVFSREGYIITNHHVVGGVGDDTVIEVTFMDGTAVRGEIVAADPYVDLAVLKVNLPKGVKPLTLGDSSKVKVGEPVLVLGNPLGYPSSLTAGIVSQTHRSMEAEGNYVVPAVIQFDAAVNPGSSGGPVLNYEGEVIGVVTQALGEGMGFAIPSNTVKKVVQSLLATGVYEHTYIGISGRMLDLRTAEELNLNTTTGILITKVAEDSPAASAGLLENDVIVQVDGVEVRDFEDLVAYSEEHRPGDTINLTVLREGKKLLLPLTLGERQPPAYLPFYANVKINVLDDEEVVVDFSTRPNIAWPLVKNAPNWNVTVEEVSSYTEEMLNTTDYKVLSREITESEFWKDEEWQSGGAWLVRIQVNLTHSPNWQKNGDKFTLTIQDPWKPEGFLDAVNITSTGLSITNYSYTPTSATDVTVGGIQEGYLLWLNTATEESPETYTVTLGYQP